MDSSSDDGGHLIQDCPSQPDDAQYRVMYSDDRNTEQVCKTQMQTCMLGPFVY